MKLYNSVFFLIISAVLMITITGIGQNQEGDTVIENMYDSLNVKFDTLITFTEDAGNSDNWFAEIVGDVAAAFQSAVNVVLLLFKITILVITALVIMPFQPIVDLATAETPKILHLIGLIAGITLLYINVRIIIDLVRFLRKQGDS